MVRDLEQIFRHWSKPSSLTEESRCNNAEQMIYDAIKESDVLSKWNISVFSQGSYRNNTNVRTESDVDICVCCMDVVFPDFSDVKFDKRDIGLTDTSYTYAQFKNEVEKALVKKFGKKGVTRGNKAFDVPLNTYRVDADVVASFAHHRYTHCAPEGYIKPPGIEFICDNGGRVINWPHQHYENGVTKNKATGNRFKFITRVIKRLRNKMADENIEAAKPFSSFLIECLVWNVPNKGFVHENYTDNVRYILAHIFNKTRSYKSCSEWGEVSDLKYLFGYNQGWTWQEANTFVKEAWNYIGFE